jgi:hypothetical protein
MYHRQNPFKLMYYHIYLHARIDYAERLNGAYVHTITVGMEGGPPPPRFVPCVGFNVRVLIG